MKKRTVAMLMAVVLLFGTVVGGTIAYLIADVKEVTNTFTVGEVVIDLFETDKDGAKTQSNTYQLIPGTDYKKDPYVEVTDETNVDCYLFVKFEELANADTYLNYTSTLTTENGWIKLDTTVPGEDADVWYRDVKTTAEVKGWYLLEGNNEFTNGYVNIDAAEVTEDTMDEAAAAELKWTAFAVQYDNLTVAEAWDLVDPTV